MRAIAGGDPAALSRLYDRHSPLVFAFCLRALRDHAEAEDLMIDIFWEIWQRHDRYDAARSSPRTYLLNVTRSRIIDRLRALRSRRSVPSVGLNTGDRPSSDGTAQGARPCEPIDEMVGTEQRARLQSAMQRLNPDQREALELAYFDAMSHSEVAARLGQPIGTVKSRIRQALIRLREVMGGSVP
jgi:RNA polymerase sigma-70 factor, ECF subfamily